MPIRVNPDYKEPLPLRLLDLLAESSKSIVTQIEQSGQLPPIGLFSTISSVSVTLEKLAQLVPVNLYAREAKKAIEDLGVLPDGLEQVRQQMISIINDELNAL